MTLVGWLQILVFTVLIAVLAKPVGRYLYRVFEDPRRPLPRVLGRAERLAYRLCGVDAAREQSWKQYALSLLTFSALGVLVTYALQRLQHLLPFNPQHLPAVPPELAFNTAASFATNTDWQSYAGEATMSYLTQMAGLAWHNFVSAGAGLGVALALARGLTRKQPPEAAKTVGNFWVDLIRSILYVLLPASLVLALVFVALGMPQNLSPYVEATTLEGGRQVIAMGPVASQEAIKELGTNGGGFFNANSAHPFENPTPLTNFLELLLIFVLPAALTYTYGRMAKDQRQGWAIFAAMMVLFLAGVSTAYWAEAHANPALTSLNVTEPLGNMEGKEVRFGVGAGLYGMLVMVLLAVFIAGLMVGRTPEYLGKKIEVREMKLAMLYLLVFPLATLVPSAWAAVSQYGTSSLNNAGPHGLSEILYAFTSAAGNNGSAFAGLNANTPWWSLLLGLTMLLGRFVMLLPVLAIAGSMAGKKTVPPGPGTFPTNGALFATLLVSVVVILSALTFFPALSLTPLVEHFLAATGRTF